MNISSLTIDSIPNKEDMHFCSCKYTFNGECQLLNKPCKGFKITKEECEYVTPRSAYKSYLTF